MKGQPLSVPDFEPFVKRFSITWWLTSTENCTNRAYKLASITKAVFRSVAVSKQLKPAPYCGYWFGSETECAHAYKISERCPSQRTAAEQCCEQLFWSSKFEAMKSMSGWEAASCDEHQFNAKIKVSTWAVFELLLFDEWSEQKRIWKMTLLLLQTIAFSCFPRSFWATILVLLITCWGNAAFPI